MTPGPSHCALISLTSCLREASGRRGLEGHPRRYTVFKKRAVGTFEAIGNKKKMNLVFILLVDTSVYNVSLKVFVYLKQGLYFLRPHMNEAFVWKNLKSRGIVAEQMNINLDWTASPV